MDEPSTSVIVFQRAVELLFLLMLIIFPQALGYIGYCRTRKKRWISKAPPLLIAPLAFYLAATAYWNHARVALIEAGYYPCGGFGVAVVFTTFGGTLFHLLLGGILFSIVTYIWKKQGKLIDPADQSAASATEQVV
jgi:hypothetical protein